MIKSCRLILLASLLASFACGCASFWHDLQPHRLRRLNRHPAPSLNPEFTRSEQLPKTLMARRAAPRTPPEMTANCAEVTLARGQNEF